MVTRTARPRRFGTLVESSPTKTVWNLDLALPALLRELRANYSRELAREMRRLGRLRVPPPRLP